MRKAIALILMLFSFSWTSLASATSVLWVDLETLGEASDVVALVEVRRAATISRPDAHFGIYTEYELQVQVPYKGEGAVLLVRLPGGHYEGRQVFVEGVPSLEVGARYLLVLEEVSANAYGEEAGVYYVPVGLKQGVWLVGEEGRLSPDLSGAACFGSAGEGMDTGVTTLSLEALLTALGMED